MDHLGLSDQDKQRLLLAQAQQAAQFLTSRMMHPGIPTGLNALSTHPNFMTNTYKRRNATKENTAPLKEWLRNNEKNPYPSKNEKMMLAVIGGMSLTQVSTWFANARRRMKKELPSGQSLPSGPSQSNSSSNLNTSNTSPNHNSTGGSHSDDSINKSPVENHHHMQNQLSQLLKQQNSQNSAAGPVQAAGPNNPQQKPLNTSISTISNSSNNTSGAASGPSDPPSPNQNQVAQPAHPQTSAPNSNSILQNYLNSHKPIANPNPITLQRQLEEMQKRQLLQAQVVLAQQASNLPQETISNLLQAAQLQALQQHQQQNTLLQQVQLQAQLQAAQQQAVQQQQAQSQASPTIQTNLPLPPQLQPAPELSQTSPITSVKSETQKSDSEKLNQSLASKKSSEDQDENDEVNVVDEDEEHISSKLDKNNHTVSIGSINPVQVSINSNSKKIWSIADML